MPNMMRTTFTRLILGRLQGQMNLYKVECLMNCYLLSGGHEPLGQAPTQTVVRFDGGRKINPARYDVVNLLAGPQLDLPHDVTTANLETLLNGLLRQTESQPYSFFVEDQQLNDELGTFLQKHQVCLTAHPR